MLKVCLLNTYDSMGGASIAGRRLFHALQQHPDVDPSLLVASGVTNEPGIIRLDRNPVKRQLLNARIALERLYFKPYHNGKINSYYFSPANTGFHLEDHPAIREADVLHLHWINRGFLSISGIHRLIALGKPMVWTLHDMWAFTGGCHYSGACTHYKSGCGNCTPFLKKPSPNDLSSRILKKKAGYETIRFVTCSEWLRDEAKTSSLLSDARIQAIPNCVNVEVFRPFDRVALHRELGLDADKKHLLFGAVSVEDDRKGFHLLIEAMRKFAANYPERSNKIVIMVFGRYNDEFDDLPFEIRSFGQVDTEDRIAQIYAAADAFVIPSLQDNLPNTIMESLACGTPVAGFRVGGIGEMVDSKRNGHLAEPGDTDQLAESILNVLDHPEYGKCARQKAIDEYTPAQIAGRYFDLYKSLLG